MKGWLQMTTTTHRTVGATLEDESGLRIGPVEDVYVDAETDRPTWMLVKVGRFTGRYALVPLAGAENLRAGRLRVPYEKSEVEWSPYARPGAPVHQDHEVELCRHYGLVERDADIASRPRHASTAMPASAPPVRVAQRARRRGDRGSKVPAWRARSNLAA
jgi:hypothetical protein